MSSDRAGPFRVSLAMIVRDEGSTLGRALESVRSVVDELVVVDTGSSDDTVAVARAAGAQVHTLSWPDDFAAARNHALDLTVGDWCLMLDGDEWLTEGADRLRALHRRRPDAVGLVEVVSTVEDATDPQRSRRTVPALLPRVLPRGVRFAGRVHEQPVHQLPTWRTGVRFGHDGYLPEPMARKADRNLRLLTAELVDHPDDAYLHYQLGKDHEVHHRYDRACAAYQRARELDGARTAFGHDLVVRSMFVLKQVGRTDAAMVLADAELERWSDSADFFFCLGDVLLDHALATPAQAEALLPLIEQAWQRCLELGDGDATRGAVAGRGSYLAAHNLALLYESTGRDAQARACRAAHPQPA